MQLPIVTTKIPGCVDAVVDQETGLLVPARDALALTEALARYIEDPSLRQAHGKSARARALLEFDPQRIWRELDELYQRTASAQIAAPR
jgi:glycosyltransferase involved in cell wall biosynthesis